MKILLTHPLFLTGVFVRLVMIVLIVPHAAIEWYVPFVESSMHHPTLNPWREFLEQGGTPLAFPYGYIMWIVLFPLTSLSLAAGMSGWFGYGATLLAADFALLLVLRQLTGAPDRFVLGAYWLSPIVLFATYWLGLNDLVPVLLLCLALLFARRYRLLEAGALCGAAVSAKLSMVLSIPLFFIYLFRNKTLSHLLVPYSLGLSAALILFCLPFAFSVEAMSMLLNNPEMEKAYELAIHFGDKGVLYILPMAYLFTLYLAWRVRRMSFDLFFVLLGVSFFLVLLLTPASPGWFLWVMPLLVYYQAKSGRVASVIVGVFTLLYVVTAFLATPPPLLLGGELPKLFVDAVLNSAHSHTIGLFYTMLITLGVILALRLWRETVRRNDYFRISRRPLVIGIAADSGAGKGTLVNSLTGLFGHHSTVWISGDDYHLWDRQKPMWQVMTHLNPRANDLERLAQDVVAVSAGKSIQSRRYDRASGKMTKPHTVVSNDFIIVSGLHALYLPILRDCYDLSIYLDISEELRHFFLLKRDVSSSNQSVEEIVSLLEQREPDAKKFVHPQAANADLVLALQPIHPLILSGAGEKHPPRFRLFVRSRRGLHEASLKRVLVGICGLHVDVSFTGDDSEIALTVEGDTTAEDVALAARELMPGVGEILDIRPRWEDGMKGLMQLIVLSHVNQALRRRLI